MIRGEYNMQTHEDVLKAIENLSNGERIKLLEQLFYKYYDNRPSKEVIDAFREWYEEEYDGKLSKG